jgi:hypothetical protein
MIRHLLAVCLLLTLAAPGCTQIAPLRAKAPDPAVNEGEWAAVRGSATRRDVIYDRFQHRATATVTYLGPAVREARVRRLGVWLGWSEQELKKNLDAEAAEAARYEDFLVAFYTADRHSDDLDSTRSVWRIALRLESGNELVTHDAHVLDANATMRNLFPYIGPFDTVYRVRFDRAPGEPLSGRRFTLDLASALGKMELTFGDGTRGPDRAQGEPIP